MVDTGIEFSDMLTSDRRSIGIGRFRGYSVGSSGLADSFPEQSSVAVADMALPPIRRISIKHGFGQLMSLLMDGSAGVSVKELGLPSVETLPRESLRVYGCIGCEWKGTRDCEFSRTESIPVTDKHYGPTGVHDYDIPKVDGFGQPVLTTKRSFDMPIGGICQRRIFWLLYLSRNVPGIDELAGTGEKTGFVISGSGPDSVHSTDVGRVPSSLSSGRPRPYKAQSFASWHEGFLKNRAVLQLNADLARLDKLMTELDKIENSKDSNADMVMAVEARRRLARQDWQDLWKVLLAAESSAVERELPKKVEIEHRRIMSLSDVQRLMRGDIITTEATLVTDQDKNQGA
jgi:hypothetical protein